jgi:hypothetical protein
MTWKAGSTRSASAAPRTAAWASRRWCCSTRAGRELALRRKRAGHLWSKHRYLSAQMLAYATDGLWLEMAQAANAAAARLAAGLRQVPGARILHEPAGNLIYAELPRAAHARAFAAGAQSTTSIPATRRWRAAPRRPCLPAGLRLVEDRGRGRRGCSQAGSTEGGVFRAKNGVKNARFFRRKTRVFRPLRPTVSKNAPIGLGDLVGMGDRHHVPRALDPGPAHVPSPASSRSRICPITGGDARPRSAGPGRPPLRAGAANSPLSSCRDARCAGIIHICPAMRAASPGGSLSKSSPEPQTDRKSRARRFVARVDHRTHPAQRVGIARASPPRPGPPRTEPARSASARPPAPAPRSRAAGPPSRRSCGRPDAPAPPACA